MTEIEILNRQAMRGRGTTNWWFRAKHARTLDTITAEQEIGDRQYHMLALTLNRSNGKGGGRNERIFADMPSENIRWCGSKGGKGMQSGAKGEGKGKGKGDGKTRSTSAPAASRKVSFEGKGGDGATAMAIENGTEKPDDPMEDGNTERKRRCVGGDAGQPSAPVAPMQPP